MKIYQIHEYGGEWEDYFDYIVASYLSKEKAYAEKERLEKEEENAPNCINCPLWDDEEEEYIINAVKENCKDYETDGVEKCVNYLYKTCKSYYGVKEEEVIE